MLFGRKGPTHKRFEYTPVYYDQRKEKSVRDRINFTGKRAQSKYTRRKRSPFRFIIFLFIVVAIMWGLKPLRETDEETLKTIEISEEDALIAVDVVEMEPAPDSLGSKQDTVKK